MLSISLVWNAKAAGRLVLHWVWRARHNVKDYLTPGGFIRGRHLILTILELNLCLAILALFASWYLEPGQSIGDVPWWLIAVWAVVSGTVGFIANLALY